MFPPCQISIKLFCCDICSSVDHQPVAAVLKYRIKNGGKAAMLSTTLVFWPGWVFIKGEKKEGGGEGGGG